MDSDIKEILKVFERSLYQLAGLIKHLRKEDNMELDKLYEKLEKMGVENVELRLAQEGFAPRRKVDLVKNWLESKRKEKKNK